MTNHVLLAGAEATAVCERPSDGNLLLSLSTWTSIRQRRGGDRGRKKARRGWEIQDRSEGKEKRETKEDG